MDYNERILAEVEARIKIARRELPQLPIELAPLLEYYDGQSVEGLAQEMMDDISGSLSAWSQEEMQVGGFEWYYDGRNKPQALGYTYESVKTPPDFSKVTTVGSDTGEARDDFDGGIKFGNMIHSDTGGFDVGKACFPVYECSEVKLLGDDDKDFIGQCINLFTLRMFHALHLVYRHLAATGVMGSMKLKKPAYFFANNHDWSPFLLFVFDANEEYQPLTETGPTRVERLQGWLDGMERVVAIREEREDFQYKVLRLPAADLERNLFSIPVLSDADGNSMEFTYDELESFGRRHLSDPENYNNISFEAFAHFFRYVLADEEAGTHAIQIPLTCLFVRAPVQAYEFISNFIDEQPNMKDAILECASNCIRWSSGGGYIDDRSPNPTLALSRSPEAVKSMEQVQNL